MMLGSLVNAIFGAPRQAITAKELQDKLDDIRTKRRLDDPLRNDPPVIFSAKHPEGVEKCPAAGGLNDG